MDGGETARAYHERTANRTGWSRPRWPPGFFPLDPARRPAPFKRYPAAALLPLPTDLPPAGPPAAEVLGGLARPAPARADLRLLARLLFYSAGVTRALGPAGDRTFFRAAPSAGNLHPVETYLACGDLDGLGAGVYHFAPDAFALERLRAGDHRGALAAALADPAALAAPAALALTGIPWRTAWKYAERGWRHVYWDAGAVLANLLTVAEAHGVTARLAFGFQDGMLCELLGIDGATEFPLAVAILEGAGAPPAEPGEPPGELRLEATPPSRTPVEFPLVTAAQRAGELGSAGEVRAWRAAAAGRLAGQPATSRPAAPAERPAPAGEPVEAVILRRGSTRRMRRAAVPASLLAWGLACAARPLPADAVPAGRTLLSHRLSVHTVDGFQPGLYGRAGEALAACRYLPAARARATAAHLCLDQALGGDAAFTLFACARLGEVLGVLGDRGYRVVQAEAGVAAERLQLAAFALGHGATGLTFYDEAVAGAFGEALACMLACAVGVPAHASRPGGPPGRPAELRRL